MAGVTIKRMTQSLSDCLVCKLLSRKIILCFQTLHFSLMNPRGAEHSQKIAINIKITLLNNKYISECGDIDLFQKPSSAQLLIKHIEYWHTMQT